jgi:hypothetical protein
MAVSSVTNANPTWKFGYEPVLPVIRQFVEEQSRYLNTVDRFGRIRRKGGY